MYTPDIEVPIKLPRKPHKVRKDVIHNSRRVRNEGKRYRQQPEVETNSYGPYNRTTHRTLTLPSKFHANYRRSDQDMTRYQSDKAFDMQATIGNANYREKGTLHHMFPTLIPAGIKVDKLVDKGIMLYDTYTELAKVGTEFWGDVTKVSKSVPIRDFVPGDNTAYPASNDRPNWLQMATKAADTFTKVQQLIKPLL